MLGLVGFMLGRAVLFGMECSVVFVNLKEMLEGSRGAPVLAFGRNAELFSDE